MHYQLSKKHIFTFAAAAALVLAVASLCVAFTVQRTQADNVLTFGSVKICVSEYELNAQGDEVAFDPAATTRAQSGDISRIVRVQNVGEQPAYVRARLHMNAVSPDGSASDASASVAFHVNCGDANSTWIDGGDGWYYYRGDPSRGGVLAAGETTENLMDSLRFTGDFYEASRGGTFQMNVDVQAVQAKNQQTGSDAIDVLDVQGWPKGE